MAGFFRVLDMPAAEAAAHPHLLGALRREELHAIRLKGVYAPEDCALLAGRILAGAGGLLRSEFPPPFHSHFHGINLNLAHPDLRDYFAAEPGFRTGLDALFAGLPPLESRIAGLLSALDGGRPFEAPPGPQPGQRFMFTTLRHHRPGGFIPPHFDNEQADRPSFDALRPLIRADLLSFVLAFTQAEAGGVLEVFNLRPQPGQTRVGRQAPPSLAGVEREAFALAPGEMVVFSSGRYLHRLTPVQGARPRLTACSFMAENAAGDRSFCWG